MKNPNTSNEYFSDIGIIDMFPIGTESIYFENNQWLIAPVIGLNIT
jgi:hypothetical protein